jgi:hypothetical protein
VCKTLNANDENIAQAWVTMAKKNEAMKRFWFPSDKEISVNAYRARYHARVRSARGDDADLSVIGDI